MQRMRTQETEEGTWVWRMQKAVPKAAQKLDRLWLYTGIKHEDRLMLPG